MQTIKRNIFITLVILFFSQVNVHAQVTPSVGNEYTITQIAEMYKAHKSVHAQNTYPSQELNVKFLKDFPNARDVEWEKSEIFYEVDFEIGRFFSKDYEAYYDMDGRLVMYKEEISAKDIPAVVKNAALVKYPKFKIDDAKKVVKRNEIFYQMELEKGGAKIKIAFDSKGTIINEFLD